MTTSTSFSLLFAITVCMSLTGGVAAQTLASQQELKPCPEPPRSSFRYVITRSELTEGTYYPQGRKVRTRGVDVLLDEKSFSESTLRQLFALITKRFPGPDELLVSVYTNLEDMRTPEEAEHIAINCTIDLATLKVPSAFYSRDIDGERFVYRSKDGSQKTIVVRDKK